MPQPRQFRQVDVFADTRYEGNPVAVVLDADGLEGDAMAQFTRWSNLSEASFLLPPTQPAADYRVRIFSSASDTSERNGEAGELPFAGHPTLGTCHAWLEAGGTPKQSDLIVQECGAGLVSIRREDQILEFAAPPLRRSGPVEEALLESIAESLRLRRSAFVDAAWVDNGPGWVAVLLDTAESVLALEPGHVDLDIGVVGPYPVDASEAFEVRAFFPKDGVTAEDPVTGSLNASLAQWLTATGRAAPPYVARQGTALGRAGRIRVSQDARGDIWVGGATHTCIRGEVVL